MSSLMSALMLNLIFARTWILDALISAIRIVSNWTPPEVEVKTVKLICDCIPVPPRGILKKPGSRPSIRKNVSFDATFHTARIMAKQSIKEWKQEST